MIKNNTSFLIAFISVVILVLAGCTGGQQPDSTATEVTASSTASASASATVAPTFTTLPSPTSAPTETSMPRTTATPEIVQTEPATGTPTATATPIPADSPTPANTSTPAPTVTWTPLPLPTVGTGGRVPIMGEAGFTIEVFANSAESPIDKPTSMTWGPDGGFYVTQMDGTVLRIAPDGDRTVVADGFSVPLGIAFEPGTSRLYVSHRGGITRLQDTNGDYAADLREAFLTGLPCCFADLHQTNGMQFGPDGWLYIAQGAMSDHGEQPGQEWHAGILRVDPNRGSESLEYVATGIRNPYDLAVSTRVMPGQIFATDNGADYGPPEELNHIIPGENYGWPFCVTLANGELATHPEWDDPARCEGTRPAIATFVPHASANGITMYEADQFPPAYRGNLFVALWSHIPGAYRIVRVRLQPAGDTFATTVTDFVTNFELPLAVEVGPDGSLYIADWGPGRIYRVSYQG